MRERQTYLVDANILLRYLMNDHPEHAKAAKRLIEEAGAGRISLEVPFVTVLETIYTLQSFYRIRREDIGRELLKILTAPGIKITGPAWVLAAVDEYRRSSISFGDACLAAEARIEKLSIASFDRGLESAPGIHRFEPKGNPA